MAHHESVHYEQDALWSGEHDADVAEQHLRFDAISRLIAPGTRSIVELGSGDGRVLREVRHVDRWLLAVDRSRAAISRWDGPGAQASIDAVPLRDQSVDVVLCCEVLEHLPPAIFETAIDELVRVASQSVVITVPNRENRRRNALTCPTCGCRFNPDRHLRSFDPATLAELLPGFRLHTTLEVGPRQPVYPRALRVLLERVGVLTRPGSPTCPQCAALHPASSAARATGSAAPTASPTRGRRRLIRVLPRRRHPYWLCARFDRA